MVEQYDSLEQRTRTKAMAKSRKHVHGENHSEHEYVSEVPSQLSHTVRTDGVRGEAKGDFRRKRQKGRSARWKKGERMKMGGISTKISLYANGQFIGKQESPDLPCEAGHFFKKELG